MAKKKAKKKPCNCKHYGNDYSYKPQYFVSAGNPTPSKRKQVIDFYDAVAKNGWTGYIFLAYGTPSGCVPSPGHPCPKK